MRQRPRNSLTEEVRGERGRRSRGGGTAAGFGGGLDAVLEPLATRFRERGGTVGYAELRELLEEFVERSSVPLDRIALLNTLRDLGIIWETATRRRRKSGASGRRSGRDRCEVSDAVEGASQAGGMVTGGPNVPGVPHKLAQASVVVRADPARRTRSRRQVLSDRP